LRERSQGRGEAGAALGGGARRGGGGGGTLLWPEVGDEAGLWAAWAERGAKPGGPGWCRSRLAGRPRPREGEASGPGRFVRKWKNQFLISFLD
jgi:hypothetical protein